MSLNILLSKYDGSITSIALQARKLIMGNIKGINEQADMHANMMAYSLAPGYKGMICNLIFSKKQIKMGFNRAVELPDPSGILNGTGKLHRYVELNSMEDLKSPALKKLLKEAEKACKIRLRN